MMGLAAHVEPIRDSHGEIVGCLGIASHERAKTPEHPEDFLVRAIHAAANALIVTDRGGNIQWVNSAFTRLTGYSHDEVLGINQRILARDANDDEVYERLWKTLLAGRPWRGEMVHRRRDGTFYTELSTISPVPDSDGKITHFISVKEDITERSELEEQLRQAQRMEAVGRLAGWVAHDFNNLLTAIIGYTDLILSDVADDEPFRADLEAVKNAGERAASLTRQLLAFSRRQVLQPKNLDLNGTLLNLEKMLRRLIGEDIELVTRPTERLGVVRADPGQVEQVLLNLAVNARDAMPSGGRLTIETSNTELDAERGRSHEAVEPGSYVMVSVSDTGEGIEEQDLVRIFEPFSKTKQDGQVSGLGLPTVYGIVKQSGGHIWVTSEPGVGTTFEVYFPRVLAAPDSEVASDVIGRGSGHETVLLVEDEENVRQLARRILVEHGYTVLTARNGAEALHLSNEHKDPIELMLTDVIMPLMSGPELARRQARLRPEMKLLYMSGYTDEAIARHGLLESGTRLLQKPFTPALLLARVREVLDNALANA